MPFYAVPATLAILGLAYALFARARGPRRRLAAAAKAYEEARWRDSLEAYRDYLRAAAPTLRHECADEILRYMAFAVGEADLEADLGGVKRALEQYHRLRERSRVEPAIRPELAAARTRLRATLDALRFVPAGTRMQAARG